MGFEDEVEQSLQRPCRQTKRQVQADMRTHLIHRPARDIVHRSVELKFPSIGFDPVEFSCCCRGLSPGPTELGAVHPDAVHDHGQPTRQRHDRLFHPATPGNLPAARACCIRRNGRGLRPGRCVREVKVASEPEALLAVLKKELPVVCVETRHMQALLKAQINKTDRNDARGMAQMMRVGLYRPVHVKTLRSQKLRMLLTHRKLLQSKAIAIENDLRGTLRFVEHDPHHLVAAA